MPAPTHDLTLLAVRDLRTAVDFYAGGLGWPRRVDTPVYVELGPPEGPGLGLYVRTSFVTNTGEPAARSPAEGTTSTELYLRCEDLDEAERRLREAGARLLAARSQKPWGDEATYFADPDGNVVVLARELRD